ncbi:MAG: zincin-like metallopeptidase domain-containing protein [Chitinophagaceae bacterium]
MDSQNTSSTKLDVYQIVTDSIVSLLEQGTVPWQKPWTDAGIPSNLISKRPYRGINLWLLLSLNYERNLFLTWDQLKKVGGSVKKGEHGHVVIYWKTPPKKDDTLEGENEKKVPILRYYKVYNIAQCRELPADLVEPLQLPLSTEYLPVPECEAVISKMPSPPEIQHKEPSAYYQIDGDFINMPKRKTFKTVEGYYATLFHELVHSTGAEKRLNRKTITQMAEFGSEMYSLEELVAELGSAYLSSFAGILEKQVKHSVAYIDGWLGKLKGDKRFMVQAAGMAQKAVDYIMHQLEGAAEATDSPDTATQS